MKEKEDGMQINGGYGGVELAGGKFTGTVHVVMGSDTDALFADFTGLQFVSALLSLNGFDETQARKLATAATEIT